VIGVIAEPPADNANVYFELGVSAALEKPIFVIAGEQEWVPDAILNAPSATRSDDLRSLHLHLGLFLDNLQSAAQSLYGAQRGRQNS
jgi:hypothetical protein